MTPNHSDTPRARRFAVGTALLSLLLALLWWLTRRRPSSPDATFTPTEPVPNAVTEPLPPRAAPRPLPTPLRWALFVTFFVALTFLLLDRPLEWRLASLGALVSVAVLIALRQNLLGVLREAWRRFVHLRQTTPPAEAVGATPELKRWQIALEIGLITLVTLSLTNIYLQPDPTTRLPGTETEWFIGMAQVAQMHLAETGTLPLWNPYYREGSPLVDNAFSYHLNPFSFLPTVLVGDAVQGMKLSVALAAWLSAVGGWFLGWTLNLSAPGRLLLAALMLGRGNFIWHLKGGYYMLGTQQAYFPWVIAGALMVFRSRHRWPVALLAVSMMLIWFAGNVWFILPMALSVGVIALAHSVPTRRKAGGWRHNINWAGWRRLMLAAALTVVLSAANLLSVLTHFDHIGAHTDENQAGWIIEDPLRPWLLFFNPDFDYATNDLRYRMPGVEGTWPGLAHFYYSFVVPGWFVLLLVLIPPIWPFLHRPAQGERRRIWAAGLVLFVVMTLWGMGGTSPFLWLYDHVPVFSRWRFVPRALSVATFWVGVLVAIRADDVWRGVMGARFLGALGRLLLGTLLLAAGLLAVQRPLANWTAWPQVAHLSDVDAECMTWLRETYPDRELAVWEWGYQNMVAKVENRVRFVHIEAQFLPLAEPITVGSPFLYLTQRVPEFVQSFDDNISQTFLNQGYRYLEDSPAPFGQPCLLFNPERALPYAFTLTPEAVATVRDWPDLTADLTQPVAAYDRQMGWVSALVMPSEQDRLLVVEELAYPGWQVSYQGATHAPEVYGEMLAWRLPPSDQPQVVIFAYRPPLIVAGALVTLLGAAFTTLYLLGADRALRRRR